MDKPEIPVMNKINESVITADATALNNQELSYKNNY